MGNTGSNNMNIRVYDRMSEMGNLSFGGYSRSVTKDNIISNDDDLKNMITRIGDVTKRDPSQCYISSLGRDKTIVYNKTNCNCEQLKDIFEEYKNKSGKRVSCVDY